MNKNTPEYWDTVYQTEADIFKIDVTRCYRYDLQRYDAVFPLLGGRVLDVGCGRGYFEVYCASHGLAIDGCDFSKWAVAENKVSQPRLHFFVAGVEDLVEKVDGQYDTVIAQEVIEHLDNPTDLLKAADGILNRSGKCIIVTPKYTGVLHSAEHVFEYSVADLTRDMEIYFDNVAITEVPCNYGTALVAVGTKR